MIELGKSVEGHIALYAGFLSFFTPCLLPMIPFYIMYITGISVEEEIAHNKKKALMKTLLFILGFTVIFVLMGTSASILGKILAEHKILIMRISGILIILFGLNMMGIFNIRCLESDKKLKGPKKRDSIFGTILMGMAFAAGWTPCFGPILASILIYASNSDTVLKGVYLLLMYSIGMGIPFILMALFIDQITKHLGKLEKYSKYIPYISGVMMIIFGVLILFNLMGKIASLFV